MKKLTVVFAFLLVFLAIPAFACDSQGSAEDCNYGPDPGYMPSYCDPGGCDVTCNLTGCSSTWIQSIPSPVAKVPDVVNVPLPDPDYLPEPDQPPSN